METYSVEDIDVGAIPTLSLKDSFKEYLEKRRTSSYSSSSYSAPYHTQRECTCFFYEHSDMYKGTKTFYTVESLRKWLDECKIEYTEMQMGNIKGKDHGFWYLACIPGEPRLLCLESYGELRDSLNRYRKAKGWGPIESPYMRSYGPTPHYPAYERQDYYHDWD